MAGSSVNPAMLESAGALGAAAAIERAAITEVGVGTTVYRVIGGESKQMGEYWTTVNPNATAGYAAGAGLPTENAMTEVVEGVITDARGITVTTAAPGAHGPGGLPEVRIPNASEKVQVTSFKPFSPLEQQ